MRVAPLFLVTALLLAGCGKQPVEENAAAVENGMAMDIEEVPANEGPSTGSTDLAIEENGVATDAWAGKWTGPEGLVLDIAKTAQPGRYDVKVTLLDGSGSYTGTSDGDAIRFTRGGVQEVIRKATGDQTGLKWLAGKQNCLMIKPSEGFCRD
ncbi:hypothetical protein [Sphingomonas colocasiae]|uniref:Lipoprotein n=1 Tax=Sphingomonas colocasiae TaxID=1848973 RepID=A0ABS7PLA8_9SPHN|nr:hypothetical protein [Sphingomonas colocasiae]MBY8820859.1 hypothetical protein [Sphingomonas colocasiae]